MGVVTAGLTHEIAAADPEFAVHRHTVKIAVISVT